MPISTRSRAGAHPAHTDKCRWRLHAATSGALAAWAVVAALVSGCGTTRVGVSSATPAASAARPTRALRTAGPSAAAGIPRALLAQARPIGGGPRFRPPPPRSVDGRCAPTLGARTAVHVELFAANRVVIVPAGIGVARPWRASAGRIVAARCYGRVVTLEPTGVVLASRSAPATLAELFAAWHQPLSTRRLASFTAPAGGRVAVFVDGRRRWGAPGSVPLTEHAEIVLEVGPHVPPHTSFAFAPGV